MNKSVYNPACQGETYTDLMPNFYTDRAEHVYFLCAILERVFQTTSVGRPCAVQKRCFWSRSLSVESFQWYDCVSCLRKQEAVCTFLSIVSTMQLVSHI